MDFLKTIKIAFLILLSCMSFALAETEVEGEEGEEAKISQPIFAELGHIILPVFDAGAPKQILVIKITLEVESTADKDIILMHEPRLRNAYLQRIYGKLEIDPHSHEKPVDIDLLHKIIREETKKIFGDKLKIKVLVPGVSQQKV